MYLNSARRLHKIEQDQSFSFQIALFAKIGRLASRKTLLSVNVIATECSGGSTPASLNL
jgi:hypothetical protein